MQDKLDPFFISKFEVCGFNTFCVRRYLVKADRNEKSSKNEEIEMNENFCFSLDRFTVCKNHTKRYIFTKKNTILI